MNLPSIYKNGCLAMKHHKEPFNPNPKASLNEDTFGLGIQVFKIESKKDIPPNPNKSKNVSQKQAMQNIENPNIVHNSRPPIVPKAKKTTGVLPVLNRTGPQKEVDEEVFPQT